MVEENKPGIEEAILVGGTLVEIVGELIVVEGIEVKYEDQIVSTVDLVAHIVGDAEPQAHQTVLKKKIRMIQ